MEFVHKSVLLEESVQWVVTDLKGIYVDCTLGGGGHSHRITELLDPEGLLIGIDQDEDAIAAATERLKDARCQVKIVHNNFRNLDRILDQLGIPQVDGILFDWGFLPTSWIPRNGAFPICMTALWTCGWTRKPA